MKKAIIFPLILLAIVLVQCKKEELSTSSQNEQLVYTDDLTAGRVMFYDKKLSVNNTVSCASCHKQSLAFSDNVQFSKGYDNRLTERNSMPIQNLLQFQKTGFTPDFGIPFGGSALFWDGRETNLNDMVLRPLVNHVEMGITDLNALAEKMKSLEYYDKFFEQPDGTVEITPQIISMELASFVSSIQSANTKFDRFNQGKKNSLNAQQLKGWVLFKEKYQCNSCHQVELPNGYQFAGTFANIGLTGSYDDPGLGDVTGKAEDIGRFKIPSLRNVALTAPYMHDGSFENLSDVIDHYASTIVSHPNLDDRLKDANGHPLKMEINETEKEAIIAFLGALTDHDMISDPSLSNPFIRAQ